MSKKVTIKAGRGSRNVKRTPPDQMPKAPPTKGLGLAALPDVSDEEDDAAFDAAWDEVYARQHGAEELKRRQEELKKYQEIWQQNKK